jgi:putative ABC transport system permease protein
MPMWHRIKTLWRNLAHRRRVEEELDEEIRSYQAMLEDAQTQAGVNPRVARREALLDLGGAERIKEEVRDIRLGRALDSIGSEFRQALRGLRRNPALTMVGAVMLALGMGASTLMFSIFYAALVQPLPFRDSARVVQLYETRMDRGFNQASFTEANFWDVRAQNHTFEEVASYHYNDANLTGDGPAEKVTCTALSVGFFRTLGVSPMLGRDFSYDEGGRGAQRVVILGNRFWKNRFGADPRILGKTLRLDDNIYTVVGVLPPGEPWINDQTYVPFAYRPDANRGSFEFSVIGRLARGVPAGAALADLRRIAGGLAQSYPKDDKGIGFMMEPSSAWVASDTTRRALWVLLGAVTFLLLIACLNIANLLLARGLSRKREIAVRTALGAGRGRLVRFVMMESILLSGFGAALGLALAYAGLRAIQALEIPGIPRLADAGLNPWVLGFAGLIAVVTGLLSGLLPALQSPAGGIATALRDGDRQTGSRRQGRMRAALVTGEVALSFLLLVGAGLLIRSFHQLMSVNPGFQTENRLLFSVNMPNSYWEKGVGKQFLDRFFTRLSADPYVVSAGAVSHRPVEGGNPGMGIASSSPGQLSGSAVPWAGWRVVSPGYFRAVGLPLIEGRLFDEGDKPVWGEHGQPVPLRRVVISQRLARLIFPNEHAVGKHAILWRGQADMDAEVVGVVGDMRERGLTSEPARTVYLPYGTIALTGEFVIQTRGNPLALLPTVRSIIAGLDPNLPIADVCSFEEVVHRSVAPQRFNTILLGVFGGLALLLATTGIYGVLSYSMSRRTAEIGLRVALGASSRSILRMSLVQGMRPVLAGLALGAVGAGWLSRYFTAMLFGIAPFDAMTYFAVAALLLATALAACYLPGRRAMRIDPAMALRIE